MKKQILVLVGLLALSITGCTPTSELKTTIEIHNAKTERIVQHKKEVSAYLPAIKEEVIQNLQLRQPYTFEGISTDVFPSHLRIAFIEWLEEQEQVLEDYYQVINEDKQTETPVTLQQLVETFVHIQPYWSDEEEYMEYIFLVELPNGYLSLCSLNWMDGVIYYVDR